jgi:hypothetical protein
VKYGWNTVAAGGHSLGLNRALELRDVVKIRRISHL